ncbi:dystrotelin [Mixophyes fleayi]|uniref:dystrotelin n=1 Tax=Mixophyes fleayi TaxID=3061075 RepID=UPI003F4DA52A
MDICQHTSENIEPSGESIPEEERDARFTNSSDKTTTDLQSITAQLVRTQKCIKDLHGERWLLKKQLSRWTGAVQVLQESQEENHCKLETQIHMLAESSEDMRKELQELRQNVQVLLTLRHRYFQNQYFITKSSQ